MAYTLPNGDITFESLEKLTSVKMNGLAGNQSDLAETFSDIHTIVTTLATVAKTGSYSDLKDTPLIPIPGNGTLTLRVNNSPVATFRADQTDDTIADIQLPAATYEQTTGSSTDRAMSQNATTTELAKKQDKLTETQMDVVNLTVNQNDIDQISTNTSDISDLSTRIEGILTSIASINSSLSQTSADISLLSSNKADKATTLAGYGIVDAYTIDEINGKLSSAMTYKGSVATVDDLPTNPDPPTPGEEPPVKVGDVYNVQADNHNYVWNGTSWDDLGGGADLSNYYTKSETDSSFLKKTDAASTYAKPSDIKNATLTLQLNEEDVGTFSANASEDKTLNFSVQKIQYTSTDPGEGSELRTGDLLVVYGSSESSGQPEIT